MPKKTLISVIVPTYNRRTCVMNAVRSVLEQDMSRVSFEVIVSDDGSTDGTQKLFKANKDKRLHYYFNPKNKGVNAARNFGIRKAKGEYVLLLDSDDVLARDAADTIAISLHRLGKVSFFGTAQLDTYRKLYSVRKPGKISYREWLSKDTFKGEFMPLIARSVFREQEFDEDRFCFEGFFWNRIIKEHGLVFFDTILRLYSFEQENRVSRKLLRVENAAKRYDDYMRYVKEFGSDYRKLKLEPALSGFFTKLSVYAMLSGNVSAARESLAEARKLHATLGKALLSTLFFFGPRVFRMCYSLALKLIRA